MIILRLSIISLTLPVVDPISMVSGVVLQRGRVRTLMQCDVPRAIKFDSIPLLRPLPTGVGMRPEHCRPRIKILPYESWSIPGLTGRKRRFALYRD
jgi:hypothetical protein